MRISGSYITVGLTIGLLAAGLALADQSPSQAPYGYGDRTTLPNGVIGISLQIGAERIGDPAILYVGMAHPEGPAYKAGIRHGDQVVSVDGTAVTGKTYEQVVRMIRGEAGTVVKLGVKDEKGLHELSVERVAGDTLPRGPAGAHGNQER